MSLFAVCNKETGDYLTSHASNVMPALYQSWGVAERSLRERLPRELESWEVVRVNVEIDAS